MPSTLPNRQSLVKWRFAYLALALASDGNHNGQMGEIIGQNRIREEREAQGLSLEALAGNAGLSTGYLSRMEKGERNVSLKNLQKIAEALRVPMAELVGGEARAEDHKGVRFGGMVEAGSFRADDGLNQDHVWRYIAMAPNPNYPADEQYAFQVVGDSMESAGIIHGMYVLAVNIYAWERRHGESGDGKLVIVARTRDHRPERELTVKRLRIFMDRVELRPESGNAAHKPFISKLPLKEEDSEWTIQAIVISASWLFV